MGDRVAKDELFDGFAQVAKALANGRRAELIDVLSQGERHVEDLATEIGQSVANTSFHLRSLAGAGLVTTRRERTRVYYRLASGGVGDLWTALREVAAAHVAELDDLAATYLGDRDQLEQISRDELARRLDVGDVVVIDVRPQAEYAAGHVSGARSVPIDELSSQIRLLPAHIEVVAYCRGPYCVFADDAVRTLQQHGLAARRLEDGYPEWRRAQLPTTGAPS